jgi:hypothetical protein
MAVKNGIYLIKWFNSLKVTILFLTIEYAYTKK